MFEPSDKQTQSVVSETDIRDLKGAFLLLQPRQLACTKSVWYNGTRRSWIQDPLQAAVARGQLAKVKGGGLGVESLRRCPE